MKVTFDKARLLSAITPAAGITQAKNTLTTIEGLLFECPPDKSMGEFEGEADNMCRISAFDLEKGLRTSLECKIYREGKYIINASKILQIVRALPDGDIDIEIDDKLRAVVSGGNSSFEIAVFPGEDFPSMPMFIGEKKYTFPQYIMRNMIIETMFAAAQNDQRPALNGELMKIANGKLTLVACDGSRLSCSCSQFDGDIVRVDGDDGILPECEVIIPAKFLGELSKILRDTEDETTMIIGRRHVIFKIDSMYFFCRMIESKYLEYEKVLPKSFKTQVYVSPSELKGALDRAAIISEDKLGGNSKSIVKLNFKDMQIDISSVSASGSIFETIPASVDGDEMTIGFTCRLLSEAVRAVPDDESRIRMLLNGPEMGICIEPCGGSSFINAEPISDNYRGIDGISDDSDTDGSSKGSSKENREDKDSSDDKNKSDFLHFVMPRHMNSSN